MARPRKTIPQFVSIDMEQMFAIQAKMDNDADFGAWFRKAVCDMRSGCVREDVDPFIKSQYEVAKVRMVKRQNLDASNYQATKNSIHTHNTTNGKRTTATGAATGNTAENNHQTQAHPLSVCESESTTPAVVVSSELKQPYGENKKVMLTVEEGAKLRKEYGENLELALDILDTYAVNNPKKFAKYKSHYAVLKKSGWVWDKVQEKITASARLNKAQSQPKSFAAQERERAAAGAAYLLSLEAAI